MDAMVPIRRAKNQDKPKPFGRYTLIQKIAHGGMATLYLARLEGPLGFEKFFAIKKIHPHLAEEHEFVRMFLDEARFASQIQHPNVVQIFELGEEDGDYFFTMEYLEGENLAAVMKEMALGSIVPPRPLLAHVVARTATGLHAAHELRGADGKSLGLVHRDVSPHNVLITYDGVIKLLDFGIAKAAGRLSQTATGELKGKYAYMAPEALLGGRVVDRRADIFSLGVVLYEATTLRRLFKDENELLTLDKIARCEVVRPSKIDPDYPPQLESILLRALLKDPDERYQTAADLASDLDAYVDTAPDRVNSATIGRWVGDLFAEQAKEKRHMLDVAKGLSSVSSVVGVAGGDARRFPLIGYGVITAIVTLAVTFAVLFFTKGPDAEPSGTLRVSSSPSTGAVSLDDSPPLGRTPLEIDGLSLGDHHISITAAGHRPQKTTFTIQRPGQLVSILVPLERIPEPAEPIKAPSTGPDAGVQQDASVTPTSPDDGNDTKVTRPPRGFGYLNLNTTPWSEVYSGGRKLGTTPLFKTKLPAGRRRLTLRPEGKTPAKHITVNIRPGATIRRTLNL